MKKLLFLLLFFPCIVFAQTKFPVDTVSGKITYTDVISVEGASKADLYTRARNWYANTFKSADATLEMENKEAGILVGKAFSDLAGMSTTGMGAMKMWYTVKVEVKDNRYRYTIDNINLQNYVNEKLPAPEMQNQMIPGGRFLLHPNTTTKGKVNKPLIEGKKQAASILEELATSLKSSMATRSDL